MDITRSPRYKCYNPYKDANHTSDNNSDVIIQFDDNISSYKETVETDWSNMYKIIFFTYAIGCFYWICL